MVKGRKLENRKPEIVEFFQSFPDKLRVVIEAGSNWMWMTDLLDDYGIENLLCHLLKTKAIASAIDQDGQTGFFNLIPAFLG